MNFDISCEDSPIVLAVGLRCT